MIQLQLLLPSPIKLQIGPDLHRKAVLVSIEDGIDLREWIERAFEEKLSPKGLGSRIGVGS